MNLNSCREDLGLIGAVVKQTTKEFVQSLACS